MQQSFLLVLLLCIVFVSYEVKGTPIAKVTELVRNNEVMVFSKSYCPYCKKAKALLKSYNVEFSAFELDVESDGASVHNAIKEMTKQRTVPNIFIQGKHIGGFDSLSKLSSDDVKALIAAGPN